MRSIETLPVRDPIVSGVVVHPAAYRRRRFLNWFPLGLAYAMLYMGRFNLTVAKNALGDLVSNDAFGHIFGIGALVYGVVFVVNGPLTDRIGGRRAMLLALLGACGANAAMGWKVRTALLERAAGHPIVGLVETLTLLYAVNMYFQSYGAVAIVKVNAAWFHVRERGGFSGIFGIMISSGIYFAFDVNERLLRAATAAAPKGAVAPAWIVFFAPAAALGVMFLFEMIFLRDNPSQAGQVDIETGDASAGEDERHTPTLLLLRRILTDRVILTVAAIEFCTGALRQGVMQWMPIFAKEHVSALSPVAACTGLLHQGFLQWFPTHASAAIAVFSDVGTRAGHSAGQWDWLVVNSGLVLMIAGIIGGNVSGWMSDRFFQSRRAPAAGLLYVTLIGTLVAMSFLYENPILLAAIVFVVSLCVIGTHGALSGTATMDFGGRKGAATAVGVIDGFVSVGTAYQAIILGKLTSAPDGWDAWSLFLLPFAGLGLMLLAQIWQAIPGGRRSGH